MLASFTESKRIVQRLATDREALSAFLKKNLGPFIVEFARPEIGTPDYRISAGTLFQWYGLNPTKLQINDMIQGHDLSLCEITSLFNIANENHIPIPNHFHQNLQRSIGRIKKAIALMRRIPTMSMQEKEKLLKIANKQET